MTDSNFELDPAICYLNHAAIAPWPVCTVNAVRRFAEENGARGSQHYPRWLEIETALRQQLQQLINAASSQEIALLKSTSEALSVVAWGLDWSSGDKVIFPAQEFPSNRIVWESLSAVGVLPVAVDIEACPEPEQRLIDALDDHTRLLSVSAVQYARGLALDLEKLGAACRQRNILFCVDAIQSLGAKPFDVQACQADFVAADGHKWMLGAEGLALFYCREAWLQRLRLHQYGWHMVDAMDDFERRDWAPAETARRFECGSPNMLGIHALHASLGLLLSTGIDTIAERIQYKTQYLIDRLADKVKILTPTEVTRRAGIVTVDVGAEQRSASYQHLQDKGVICAMRGGGIRFSPHYYTPDESLDKAIHHLLESL